VIRLPVIHYDCRQFYGDRPCAPNKELGVFCGDCPYYEKDPEIHGEFQAVPAPPTINENGEKKIIIIKLDAVGDVLRTTSILPSLKEKYTESTITWVTKERSYEVLKDNDLIDEIYFTTDEASRVYNLLYDIAINLDSGKESCEIMRRINTKASFGYTLVNNRPYPVNLLANEWYLMGVNDNVKKTNRKTYHKIIHEICGLDYSDSAPFINITAKHRARAEEIRENHKLHKYKGFTLINLGGGNRWQYKKWTKEGYIELISMLAASSPDIAIGIIAGDEDREFYSEIASAVCLNKNVINFGCENSLEDFICIVSLADKVFTSDSLCMHISTALDKYTVVVTGPTSYTELDVFGNGRVVHSDKVDCLCCYLNRCDKTITCMNTIEAAEIYTLLNKITK
jgi:ADP-heptose:LPS heptosyltransferase